MRNAQSIKRKGRNMLTEWMGRYRNLIATLVRHVNLASTGNFERDDFGGGVMLRPIAWQTLEYSIEHSDHTDNMTDIARNLGITQSTFSKLVKELVSYGFVEKYMATNNRKNVILRPTDKGIAFYHQYNDFRNREIFTNFMTELDSFSDEEIARFTHALDTLNNALPPASRQGPVTLVKKE